MNGCGVGKTNGVDAIRMEVVLEAVKNDGNALDFADSRLKGDLDICMASGCTS